jgi:predicted transcriptional regulator
MSYVVDSERYALKLISELEKVKPGDIGEEMGFSTEYATVLCRSLWKNGYIRGTAVTGYEITQEGENFLANLKGK